MTDLINKKSVPHDRIKLLAQEEIKSYLSQLKEGWSLDGNKIKKQYVFEDQSTKTSGKLGTRPSSQQVGGSGFVKAMEFVNKVAAIAEDEGHHPGIAISYNKVEITLWTHFVNGLSENDFIVAAKIDALES